MDTVLCPTTHQSVLKMPAGNHRQVVHDFDVIWMSEQATR